MSRVIAAFRCHWTALPPIRMTGPAKVFRWYSSGGTDAEVMTGDGTSGMSREGAGFIEEAGRGTGVLVTARRTFDLAHAWSGKHPVDVPMVVVTHKDVVAGAPSVTRQCLQPGLLDATRIDLAPAQGRWPESGDRVIIEPASLVGHLVSRAGGPYGIEQTRRVR